MGIAIMPEYHGNDPSAVGVELGNEAANYDGKRSVYPSTGRHGIDHEKMSRNLIREKFISDHQMLRGKAAVVAALALDVLRGDEDLASALRIKGEELYAQLLDHMQWEENLLLPLLAKSSHGAWTGAAIIKEHHEQRLRLDNSLTKLRHPDTSFASLGGECLEFVRWLEVDMTSEERTVLRWLSEAG